MEKQKNTRFYLGVILLLVLLGVGLFFANQQFSNAALAHLRPDKLGLDASDVARNVGDVITDPFAQGAEAIKNKDFKKAVSFFETVTKDSPTYTQACLLLAYAQFELKNYARAIANTKIVINQSTNRLSTQKAEWLQLQAMLANDETATPAFDALLDKIAQDEKHLVQKEAGSLKQSMNSFWRGLVF